MKTSAILTTEESSSGIKNPVLIVDKDGIIGKELILKLGKDVQVVFVTRGKHYLPDDYARSVIFVPFIAKFPTIPDGSYSFMFIVDSAQSQIIKLLPSFLEKARRDEIPIVYALSIAQVNEKLLDFKSKYSRLKILVYGDIFDKNLSLHQDALINKFLYDAVVYEKIEVPGNGLGKTYPVYLDDVIACLLETIFGAHVREQLFFAFPKHSPTDLYIAHAIQKAKPEVKIDFSSQKGERERRDILTPGLYLLEYKYPLDARIREVVSEVSIPKAHKEDLEKHIKKEKVSFFPALLFLLFLFVLPFVATISFLVFGILGLFAAETSFNKGDISSAASWAGRSQAFFSVASASYEPLYFETNILGIGQKIAPLGQAVGAGKDISGALVSFSDAYKKLSLILIGKSSNPEKDFGEANLELSDALVSLKRVEGSRELSKAISAKLKENSRLLNFVSSVQSVLPQLMGVGSKRNYLVLFQNNMELRPTGGFIGSYGILSLDKGKISSFTISDVYDADGQLKGHVEPPFPIRRYLPSEHWYLRDSNFALDFPKAASAAAFFLKTETKQDIDGVMAIDVFFVQKLLVAMGDVRVPEYNETVTAENFFKLAVAHSQKDFFPGSTQKKDFLGALFRAMQQRFETKKDISYVALVKAIEESIASKDILLVSFSPTAQGVFTINNWSGSLWDQRQERKDVVNDFVGINEANLGVNKVNYFVTRKVSKNTIVNDEGEISSEVNISFENKSDGSWPGGNYKNYLRIILPQGTVLSSVSIDGKEQETVEAVISPLVYESTGFKPPKSLEVERTEQDAKTVFGVLFNIPKGSKRTITFAYTIPSKLDLLASTYNLKIVKQPGVLSIPFEFYLSYPTSQEIISASGAIIRHKESASFEKDIISDEEISVKLAKNK
ncbi:MAG: DUF4012 domain-containing protein [Candidatus Levybacteria bacterium]|nr:DUF4012 domain-containing protein [Candidatus Levybacteria bacterium]